MLTPNYSAINALMGWDEDVHPFNFMVSVFTDFFVALAVGACLWYLGFDLLPFLAAVGVYLSSVIFLRGLTGISLGGLVGGIEFSRASSGRSPGILRCVAYETIFLLRLPLALYPVDWLLDLFSERIAGLRVSSTR